MRGSGRDEDAGRATRPACDRSDATDARPVACRGPRAPLLAALRRAATRWQVTLDGEPLHSASGCVAFGIARRDGRERAVVVKVAAPHADETRAWAVLRHHAGRGSVALLDHADDASLLARVRPGRPLAALVREGDDRGDAGADDAATAVLCDVAAALHAAPPWPDDPPVAGMPTIADWGQGFARWRRAGRPRLPARLVDDAAARFDALVADQQPSRLLHGDLHHHNVLLDAERGWLAIDPKGVLGEPAYEFGALLRNPAGPGSDPARVLDAARIARRVAIVAERAALDRARVLAWAHAQAVLSAVWSVEDGEDPTFALALAERMRPLPGIG